MALLSEWDVGLQVVIWISGEVLSFGRLTVVLSFFNSFFGSGGGGLAGCHGDLYVIVKNPINSVFVLDD